MKPIKLVEKNTVKLSDAIKEAEGKARVRTVTAQDMFDAAKDIEHKLNIPKLHMTGITATVSIHSQNFPHAYKYIPEGTEFHMIYKSNAWYITQIYRSNCNRGYKRYHVSLPEAARDAIIQNHFAF